MNPPSTAPAARLRRVVLLVDDSPIVRLLVERILAVEPYDLIVASGGEEGLQAARAARPDLILLDFMLGDMQADEFCRRLETQDPPLRLPVLLVSAYQRAGLNFVQPGRAWYLPKPFDAPRLRGKLREVFGELEAARPLSPVAADPEPRANARLVPRGADPVALPAPAQRAAPAQAVSPFAFPAEAPGLNLPLITLRHGLQPGGAPPAQTLRLRIEGNAERAIDYGQVRAVVRVQDTGLKLICRAGCNVHLQSRAGRNALAELLGAGRVDWLEGSAAEIRVEGGGDAAPPA